jgi:hypothetical protein
MATEYITHSCGHQQKHTLPLNKKSWDWFRKEKETELCTDCWKLEQAKTPPGPNVKFRACAEGVEIVVTNAYHYKDTLAARGYRFAYTGGGLTAKGIASNLLAVAYGSEKMHTEVHWLKSQGWIETPIKIEEGFNPMSAVMEGREDLIDAKINKTVDADLYDKYRTGDQDLSECVSDKQAAYALACKIKVINMAQNQGISIEDLDKIHEKFPKLTKGNWWIDASKNIAKLYDLIAKANQ